MSAVTRYTLIQSFNEVRPSFLAAIDQIVAEMRPRLQSDTEAYEQSLIDCACAFAEPSLVRQQVLALQPDLAETLSENDLADAHLATVSYLFSLALHELMRAQKEELPQ